MHVQTSNLRHNSIDLQDWSSSGDELLIISKNSHGGFHGQDNNRCSIHPTIGNPSNV